VIISFKRPACDAQTAHPIRDTNTALFNQDEGFEVLVPPIHNTRSPGNLFV
jgi:hypothetical protein